MGRLKVMKQNRKITALATLGILMGFMASGVASSVTDGNTTVSSRTQARLYHPVANPRADMSKVRNAVCLAATWPDIPPECLGKDKKVRVISF